MELPRLKRDAAGRLAPFQRGASTPRRALPVGRLYKAFDFFCNQSNKCSGNQNDGHLVRILLQIQQEPAGNAGKGE
jgi:hypothetical protein